MTESPLLDLAGLINFVFFDEEILIVCDSLEAFRKVRDRRDAILRYCKSFQKRINRITVVSREKERLKLSFPQVSKSLVDVHNMITQGQVQGTTSGCADAGLISIPAEDLIKECHSFAGSAGIVRWRDNKGLFANSLIEMGSAARPNDWIGANMADYWPADQLSKFRDSLQRDKEIRNFSYKARLFNGQMAEFLVDARLVIYEGDLARIVKTHSCVTLE